MKYLTDTDSSLVIRTDFSDEAAWEHVCAAIPEPVGEFQAYVDCVSDPDFKDLRVEDLPERIRHGSYFSYIFMVDKVTISNPEHPVLVVDLYAEVGRTFRVIPAEMWAVENNLSIANMDFAEFANAVDEAGVFRGFTKEL